MERSGDAPDAVDTNGTARGGRSSDGPSDGPRDGTRDRILEAALVVMRDVGHGLFSVQKVARQAGLYQGNITYYWPRRRDLMLALAVRVAEDYRRAFVGRFSRIDMAADDWAAVMVRDVINDAVSEERVRLLPELWSMANTDVEIAQAVTGMYEDVTDVLLEAMGVTGDHPRRAAVRRALVTVFVSAQGVTVVHGHRDRGTAALDDIRQGLVSLQAPFLMASFAG